MGVQKEPDVSEKSTFAVNLSRRHNIGPMLESELVGEHISRERRMCESTGRV